MIHAVKIYDAQGRLTRTISARSEPEWGDGKCSKCDKDAYPKAAMCLKHLTMYRIIMRKAQHTKPWQPGKPGRPPVEVRHG